MSLLTKSALRTMSRNKKIYAACVIVISMGIMSFTALSQVYATFVFSQQTFYEETTFADVFVRVKEMPKSVLSEISRIEGISTADGRITTNARVFLPDSDHIISLRVMGYDPEQTINTFAFFPSAPANPREILLGTKFFEAHHFVAGDEIDLVLYGNNTTFTIKGSVQSPEHIYLVPEDGSLLSNPYTFGSAVVSNEVLENSMNMQGMVTDIGILLESGFTFDDVKNSLEHIVNTYGLVHMYEQKNQPSHMLLESDLGMINGLSLSMSALFLFVAACILYIMLRRAVEQERTQIGTLKAFGFSNKEILRTYLIYGAITGVCGGLLGAITGIYMGGFISDMMLLYYDMPALSVSEDSRVYLTGIIIATVTATISARLGAKGVLSLKPAEAMRPAAPPVVKNSIFDAKFLTYLFNKRGLMSLRYIERNKMKSALIVLSVSMGFVLMAVMFSYSTFLPAMLRNQFQKIEVYDLKVNLREFQDKTNIVSDLQRLRGVQQVEGVLELPIRINHRNHSKDTMITGLNQESNLYRIMDETGNFYNPPKDGLFLSFSMAQKLGVIPGDVVTIDSPYFREKVDVKVADVIRVSMGSTVYKDVVSLGSLLPGGLQPVNTLVLHVEAEYMQSIKDTLIDGKNVMQIADSVSIINAYQLAMEPFIAIIFIILAMAIIVSFAVIYNISGISLAERTRELATMRVLGYSVKDTTEILSIENYVLCALAIVIGIPLTILTTGNMSDAMDNELFSLPEKLPYISYVYAAICCILAVALSNWGIKRNVRKFHLVDVLKERE